MKYQDIIYIAELGLRGDKKKLLNTLNKAAAEASNKKQYSLYHSLKEVVGTYSNHSTLSQSSINEEIASENRFIHNSPDEIWLPKRLEYRVNNLLSLHKHHSGSKGIQQRLNKILLYGPPGTGKTTLGFYLAKKLKRPIEYIKVSDVISARFGETMKNLANIFHSSRKGIIFIDEFDAFAKNRTDSNDVGELKRIVSSLIQTLDFYSSSGIVIVATNLIESLDPAILRRFPYRILVDVLDKEEQSEFVLFLMNSIKDVKFDLTNDDIKFLGSLIYSLNLITVDQIQQLFDKAIMLSLVNKIKVVQINQFIETIVSSDYINQRNVKSFRDDNPKVFKGIASAMEIQGFPKSYISELLGIHRNSYKKYAK